MSEPRLEDIEDYNTLKGQKRRVVLAIVLASLIIGTIYVVASSVYGSADDSIKTQNNIKNIPIK